MTGTGERQLLKKAMATGSIEIAESKKSAPGTFDEFFMDHYTRACRFACAVIGAAEAEDAAQDAFFRLYLRRTRWSELRAPEAYFYRMLYNECLSRHRRRQLWMRIRGMLRPTVAEPPPVERLDFEKLWQTFSPRERSAFLLVHCWGRSDDEASAWLGIRPSTLRVYLHRVRNKIRAWETAS
jgi:RNA polymerase sigma factor (sigma-70 family)